MRLLRAICAMVMPIMFCLMVNARTFREHTVDRGETIESIAKKYNVTTDAILSANPELSDMFFTGIVIKIPVDSTSGTPNTQSDTTIPSVLRPNDNNAPDAATSTGLSISYDARHATGVMDDEDVYGTSGSNAIRFNLGYDINSFSNKSTVESYNSGFSMEANLFIRHYFIKGLYGEGGVGFSYSSLSMSPKSDYDILPKSETNSYAIPVNVLGGYTFTIRKNLGLELYTGFIAEFGVKSTYKNKYRGEDKWNKKKMDTSNACGWNFGATLHLWSFDIGATYRLPLSTSVKIPEGNNLKKNTTVVYIGWTCAL